MALSYFYSVANTCGLDSATNVDVPCILRYKLWCSDMANSYIHRVSSTGEDRGEASPPSHLTSPQEKLPDESIITLLLCGATHLLQVAHRGSMFRNGLCHTPSLIRQRSLCVSFSPCWKFLDETLIQCAKLQLLYTVPVKKKKWQYLRSSLTMVHSCALEVCSWYTRVHCALCFHTVWSAYFGLRPYMLSFGAPDWYYKWKEALVHENTASYTLRKLSSFPPLIDW